MKYVLYNPLSDNNCGKRNAEHILTQYPADRYTFIDITKLSREEIFSMLNGDDDVILAGGDGTLNRFVNMIGDDVPEKHIWYYPSGSGNDFMNDIRGKKTRELIELNRYMRKLPTVTVNGKKYRFLNGIGCGLDGYCCDMVDRKKQESDKKANYALVAFMGLLRNYSPTKATVTVDGVTVEYDDCWMVPTMNGRYFGGGIKIAPNQDRLNSERMLTVVVLTVKNRMKTFLKFPSVFRGDHLKYTDIIKMFTGKTVTVTFDRPTSMQIDGEPIRNVLTYTVNAYGTEKSTEEKHFEELQKI